MVEPRRLRNMEGGCGLATPGNGEYDGALRISVANPPTAKPVDKPWPNVRTHLSVAISTVILWGGLFLG